MMVARTCSFTSTRSSVLACNLKERQKVSYQVVPDRTGKSSAQNLVAA
jgi:hypothetical protein